MVGVDVAGLWSAGRDAAGELLVDGRERVSPLNTYSVVVAYLAPLPVDDATEYHLKG